jgi:amidophosphoribosyltransferase
MRIASPPIRYPCFMGVDMATQEELIAAQMDVDAIAQHLGVDSLGYLSHEGLVAVVGAGAGGHCMACFTNEYPIPTHVTTSKTVFEPQ